MVLSNQRVEDEHKLGEDRLWECKQIEFRGNRPNSPRHDNLSDEIARLATASDGFIVCGATASGEAQGMSRKQMDVLERVMY